MRNVGAHLLEDKMEEVVTHYINSHQSGDPVHVDANSLSLNVQDETGRVVTVMQSHSHGYSTQMRQVVEVEGGTWSEEIIDQDMRIAALVAQLAHQNRSSHHHHTPHHKISSVRDVDSTVILDAPMRLFNQQPLDSPSNPLVVQVPPLALPSLPPLQEMKRHQDTDWYHNKTKTALKENAEILAESDPMLDMSAVASPGQHKQQNKKSLPHKKRISRKLKRNAGNSTPQQDIVVINCASEVPQEEILPDNFVSSVQHHQEHLSEDAHHIAQEVRPLFICQECGEFYGEDQIKFYHHLKQHYEPHSAATIIIENSVGDLSMDKMTNPCIEDNGATLPDSIVELSLENTVPKTVFQPMDKHILYSSSDKTLYNNKVQYSMANMSKESVVPTSESEKADVYISIEQDIYDCVKCNKSFRKQKQFEAHVKEVHSNAKLEDMGEFSEPEDLMEGIHVAVEEGTEQYDTHILPHLTVENGHVHQEHVRTWYLRGGSPGTAGSCGAEGAFCPVCPAPPPPPSTQPAPTQPTTQLKEEVLQRIFESEVPTEQNFSENIIEESEIQPETNRGPQPEAEPPPPEDTKPEVSDGKKKGKKCECPHCGRVFVHRNSLLYHLLSHRNKEHLCRDCGKAFYTANALKVHKRVHNGDRPYKCDQCGREFRQWSDLKYHTVSIHSNQKHFKCEYCEKEFARKYSLNIHRKIHTGERNYKCFYCNKCFRASSYRLAHMRTHTGDRPHKCAVCDKCFRVAADLRRHMLTHDKTRARLDDAAKIKLEPKKPKNEPQIERKPEPILPKLKIIAVASTSRPPLLQSPDKKPKPVKKAPLKKGLPPNVTVVQTRNGEFKLNSEYSNNVEVFDTRQEYSKYKEVYSENSFKAKDYNEQIFSYKESEHEREFAVLRPMFRVAGSEEAQKPAPTRAENTDGKMQVFTHVVDKGGPLVPHPVSLEDIRSLERERQDLHGETIENGFLENLSALYNIPAV